MGNMHCPAEDASHLASLARDVCPFPNYSPNPLFVNMLSPNSSLHLRKHYMEVQSSLTPMQLEDFTQGLRRTFGKEGKVTLGGVGVVALSLAVLFDTLAKQAKGECLSDSGPIPGLFIKNQRGYYPPHVYTISEYLRLVPHIANNPTRMREETERYFKQLGLDDQSMRNLGETNTVPINEAVTSLNWILGKWFADSLQIYLLRIKNGTADEMIRSKGKQPAGFICKLNCDPNAADKLFLAEVKKSDSCIQEVFKRHMTNIGNPRLLQVAQTEWLYTILDLSEKLGNVDDLMIAQRDDFDLKANRLGKWAE